MEVTEETLPYINQNGDFPPYNGQIGGFAHFPSYGNGTTNGVVKKGYTLLSAEDFKRLVLDSQPAEIDWSVPGQYFIDTDKFIVVNNGIHEDYTFQGTIIHGPESVGMRQDLLLKSDFYPYTGEPIILN